jgi:hypothetical protein
VRPGTLALLDQRNRHLAERLGERRLVLEKLGQPDGAGQARGPAADDHDTDLDPLLFRIDRHPDELGSRVDGRWKFNRSSGHEFLATRD